MYTVTEIVALFHQFSKTNDVCQKRPYLPRRRRGSSALLLTQITPEAAQVRTRLGRKYETKGIDAYVENFAIDVSKRNEETIMRTMALHDFKINVRGRPDGITKDLVVEHKYRVHGLLGYVPFHERVQCHLYMRMFDLSKAHLVETFRDKTIVHEINFDLAVWDRIASAVGEHRRLHQIS